MLYKYYNPNPVRSHSDKGDCVIRALTKALNKTWDCVYWELCELGYSMGDWGNSNYVWDIYLKQYGFKKNIIPDTCPSCYTIKDFCYSQPYGVFILATGSHVVAVKDGNYYDSWDSGNEVPLYYYSK